MKMHFKIMLIKLIKRTITMSKKIIIKIKKEIYIQKLGNVSAKSNFTDSDNNPSYGDDTENLSNHSHFDDDMSSFDITTVKILQKNHFHRNILKFSQVVFQVLVLKLTQCRIKLTKLHPTQSFPF